MRHLSRVVCLRGHFCYCTQMTCPVVCVTPNPQCTPTTQALPTLVLTSTVLTSGLIMIWIRSMACRVDCEQSLRMVTRARKSSDASESKNQEAEALSSPAALRLDWLKRDCSQSSMRGTYETIARILQPYNIRVAHKLITTLRRLLTNVKDKDKQEDKQGNSKQDQMLRLPGYLH